MFDHDIPVTREAITHASITSALQSACGEEGLLVMANTRRTALSRILFGSVSHDLIGRLRIPLLLIPPEESDCRWSPRGFRRILVPLDRFDGRERVLQVTEAFAPLGTDCHLLHVFPMDHFNKVGVDGRLQGFQLRDQAWRELNRAKDLLKGKGVEAYTQFVADRQSAAKSIVGHITSLDADLVVLSARPHRLPWWLRASVPEYVVRHAMVPVLIVPSENTPPFIEKETDAYFP
jgi:nucleotide-binding universal stress UspA family protein